MTDLDDDLDPFSDANVRKVQLIVLMRIYDVLNGILAVQGEKGEELSNIILEAHDQGRILGPLPWIDLSGEAAESEGIE